MLQFNSHRPDSEWHDAIGAEPNPRLQKVGGWFVFLVWVAGMMAIYFLLLHAGYVKSYNEAPPARPEAASESIVEQPSAGSSSAEVSNALIFKSTQSFFDFFNGRYGTGELRTALENAISYYGVSSPSSINVLQKGEARGLSFLHDYEIVLQ